MIDARVLEIVMWAELSLLAFSVVAFFLHGWWLYLSDKRDARLTAEGRQALVRLLDADGVQSLSDIEILRALPRDVQTTIFLEISKSLSGSGSEDLKRIAALTGIFDRARKMCSSRRWTRRLKGARLLAQMEQSDPLVTKLLRDSHPAVRAQAAEWAAARPIPEVLGDLLDLLADPETLSRFAVQDALLRMGREAAEPLASYLENHSGQAATSGLHLAEAMVEPVFIPAALAHSQEGIPEVRAAAASLLGAVGGTEAAARLVELLDDTDPDVRAAAAFGLGRMRHWPAASRLSGLLMDSSWAPRRAAALALRAIGAPGILLLRRAASSPSQSVSDIAQMVLDMPAAAR
ncbi:MAG: HEAT repeat domain-containing protein [Gemmatimonadaceae bacterium]